jgi:2-methylcitrate dehydratase PrpD
MSHALEYDDLHRELPLHAGTIVVPAALALADACPETTGAELTTAIVAGTEIAARLARATRSYRGKVGFRGWNPTSVVAGFGAAAVAARLLGLDADGIARAMGIAYAQASGNQQCIADGGLVKRMQPGFVAEAGVRAAYLARAGITGAVDALEGRNGFFRVYEQGDYDPAALTDGLGHGFEIERLAFKRYPVCGMAHPAIDSLRELLAQPGFSREEVAAIAVEGSGFVVDMVGRPYRPGPSPEVDAQFNLAYCLAAAWETGTVSLADLEPARTLDPGRRERADAIPVTLDTALEGKWTSRVRVRNRAGAEISRVREAAASQREAPLTRAELVAKFLEAAAASGALGEGGARRLADLLLQLPDLPAVMPLLDALSPGPPVGASRPCR